MITILQTGRFKRAYKKLHPNQLADVNEAIGAVTENPEIGECKTGDLPWLRVYKFKMCGQLTLLGYCVDDNNDVSLRLSMSGRTRIFTGI